MVTALHCCASIQSLVHIYSRLAMALALTASTLVAADPKRELPDYDGRGNTDTDADSWPLWIPRVALSPLYAVNEYVLRRPIGAFVTTAEHHHWANTVTDLFTFGPHDNFVIMPTALFDFGLLPSIGVYLAGDDAWTKGNSIRLHAATWGPDWINATALDRLTWNADSTSLAARVEFKRQADLLFFGTGPDVTRATRSRYGLQRFDTGGTFQQRLGGESLLIVSSGVRTTAYRAGDCCGDPSLDTRIAAGSLAMPPGYGVNYTTLYQSADIALDTRLPRPASATGGYLDMHVEADEDSGNQRRWVKYGAVFGVAADLANRQRTIKAQLAVDYADPLQGGVVPFNELASLGGTSQMPGFLAGWMNGRSTITAQLGYSWPVWMWLDGQARFSVGNAFDAHLGDFAVNKLRLSGDIGVTSVGKRDAGFELLFGVGTETLQQGVGITSVRLSVGSRKGF
jgi:hypothetical protein